MKFVLIPIIFFQFLYAQVQTVSVGNIDKRYKDKITQEQLITMIKDVENLFETQLGFNVFDYVDKGGKPIDIIYLPPSQKKKRIERNKIKAELLKKQFEVMQSTISYENTILNSRKTDLEYKYRSLNQKIKSLNSYISRKSSSRNLTRSEYDRLKHEISSKKRTISMQQSELESQKRKYNSDARSLQRKASKHKSLLRRYKWVIRDIERLSRNYKEIKGKTKKRIITTVKTKEENGETITHTNHSYDSQKIEIYDFENLTLLKVILAHEIGHLVGVDHIDAEGALMHPELQKEQRQELHLTSYDIRAFQDALK